MTTEIKARIHLTNDGPCFGGYAPGSASYGKADIVLCLENCSGACESREEFDRMVQETLVHELLHAVQEVYGQMFSESLINGAMANPNEIEVAEDVEQMIQQMAHRNAELEDELANLKAQMSPKNGTVTHTTEDSPKQGEIGFS